MRVAVPQSRAATQRLASQRLCGLCACDRGIIGFHVLLASHEFVLRSMVERGVLRSFPMRDINHLHYIAFFLILSVFPSRANPQMTSNTPAGESSTGQVRLVDIPLKSVEIHDGFWSPRIEVNRTKTLDHVYRELSRPGRFGILILRRAKPVASLEGPGGAIRTSISGSREPATASPSIPIPNSRRRSRV